MATETLMAAVACVEPVMLLMRTVPLMVTGSLVGSPSSAFTVVTVAVTVPA